MRQSQLSEATQEQNSINGTAMKYGETTIQDLASQMAKMQQQLNAISAVEKHIVPPEMLEENQRLSKEVQEYRTAWEDIVKENQRLIEDRKASIVDKSITKKQHESLLEEYEKIKKERDVLLEKLRSFAALTKNFNDACIVLCKDEETQ